MRLVRVLAVLACTSALVSACGDDEPSVTAQQKFCTEYRAFYEATNAGESDEAATVKRIKSFATKVATLDTPEQMSQDAAAGMAILVEQLSGLSDDATQADVIALEADMTADESAQLDAFYLYSNKTCISGAGN